MESIEEGAAAAAGLPPPPYVAATEKMKLKGRDEIRVDTLPRRPLLFSFPSPTNGPPCYTAGRPKNRPDSG